MKLISNIGDDRVVDLVAADLPTGGSLDVVAPHFSIFGFAALRETLKRVAAARMVLPPVSTDLALLGDAADRPARNRLESRWLARVCADWLREGVDVRPTAGAVPQGMLVVRGADGEPVRVVHGAFSLTTAGLGVAPGNPLSLIQASETADEARLLSTWFEAQWATLAAQPAEKQHILSALQSLAEHGAPHSAYALVLHCGSWGRICNLAIRVAARATASLPVPT